MTAKPYLPRLPLLYQVSVGQHMTHGHILVTRSVGLLAVYQGVESRQLGSTGAAPSYTYPLPPSTTAGAILIDSVSLVITTRGCFFANIVTKLCSMLQRSVSSITVLTVASHHTPCCAEQIVYLFLLSPPHYCTTL